MQVFESDAAKRLGHLASDHAAERNHLVVVLWSAQDEDGWQSIRFICQQCDTHFDNMLHEHDGKAVFFNGIKHSRENR